MMNHLCKLTSRTIRPCFTAQNACSVRFLNQAARQKILMEKDDNDRALEQLDPTLLKPFPEYRTVAAGPILPNNFCDLIWKPWKENNTPQKLMEPYDKLWEKYEEEYGFSPLDYFKSLEFEDRYNGKLVWLDYFRRKKGRVQKQRTRKSCKKHGVITTASPCPLCRDDNLLISYKNVPLLNQFIDHHTMEVYGPLRTGACRVKHTMLLDAIDIAKQLGYLESTVVDPLPARPYDEKRFTFAV